MTTLSKNMQPILKADSLFKKFGDIVAVDNISFEINRGEIFGFLGPNGAGKTTTIRIMSGLLKPDGGRVLIDGNHYRSIGICPQHIVIWENLTCLEQIIYMGRMYDMSSREAAGKGMELLESLGLAGIKDRMAKKLSGGMQRRLNIALALIHSPEIVFLDEPQAGLDPQSRVLVRDYIRSIKNKTTIVLTTHDMEEAEKLSDRICIIDKGRLLVSGSADEIKKASGNEDLIEIEMDGDAISEFMPFVDPALIRIINIEGNKISLSINDPVSSLENIAGVARRKNLRVKSLRMRKASLEDIFINLTGRSLRE
jgi:ABC-2 type transport system ATP-binding protein